SRLRRLGMMLNSCCCSSPLPLIDVKGFDPKDVTVTMKDGKVTVSAERKEECNTCRGKACSYRKYMKQFSLPPTGCCDKEVTYSV
ncbi:ODFP1 protein, partial [Cisticola juncidis]|nr:ODFP1 protein [Cisticola juncidis]